jgi:hypothetical protein
VRIVTRTGQNVGLKITNVALVCSPMFLMKRSFTNFPMACTTGKGTVAKKEEIYANRNYDEY